MSFNKYSTSYWLLVLLRIILVFIPQLGYIHPDEYFQSVEVIAGKTFDVQNNPPWEFNTNKPIRSATIIYFTIGLSYQVLKLFNYFLSNYFDLNMITPYWLLVFPRLLICLLSFLVDYSLYKICVNNNEKYKTKLLVLASSYVMIIYGTRTFSNTIELILLSILMYFVCDSLTFSNILIKKKEYLHYRYENSQNVVERAKFHKLKLYLEHDTFHNAFYISTITVLGFFNRPTFLAFALFPVFFWLYRGIGSKCVLSVHFHLRIMVLAICSIPTFLIVILIDSFFYGYITWGEIGMLDISINSFVFAPLNFLKYNMDPENLSIHGLHPKYLHIVANIPVLYNVLGICAIVSLFKYAYMIYRRKLHLLPSVKSIKGVMTLSWLAPVIILSFFPHQEPRFLVPIILPLSYLHGNTILNEPHNVITEIDKNMVKPTIIPKPDSNTIFKIWVFANLILGLFYGFIHQGGIFPATSFIYKDLKRVSITTEYHIVTSHIYSLPESFLVQKPTGKIYKVGKKSFTYNRRVYLESHGSEDLEQLYQKIKNIRANLDHLSTIKPKKKFKLFLLISSSLTDEITQIFRRSNELFLYEIKTFYPHFSSEAVPNLWTYCLDTLSSLYSSECKPLPFVEYFKKVYSQFGLSLFEILV